MNVVAIIQARMASTRLPGKVLKQVMGRPLLEYQLERLACCDRIDRVIIATTDNPMDAAIVEFCAANGVEYVRGSEQDVLDRYLIAARQTAADLVVRITSDCPLIDPLIVDSVVSEYFRREGTIDYCSNTLERTFPRGMDTEVLPVRILEQIADEAVESFDREHVTPFVYRQPDRFRLHNLPCMRNLGYHRWTVDTPEDFEFVSAVLTELYPTNLRFSMDDTLVLLEAHPELVEINRHITQKGLHD